MATIPTFTPLALTGANVSTGLRSHSCNELRLEHVGQTVKLCGWVQQARDMNHFAFVDLRDRYGITQIVFINPAEGSEGAAEAKARYEMANSLGREFVIAVEGVVVERSSKNASRPTGDVEVQATAVTLLNAAKTPPFLIQDKTDAGEEVRTLSTLVDCRAATLSSFLLSFLLKAQGNVKWLDAAGVAAKKKSPLCVQLLVRT